MACFFIEILIERQITSIRNDFQSVIQKVTRHIIALQRYTIMYYMACNVIYFFIMNVKNKNCLALCLHNST